MNCDLRIGSISDIHLGHRNTSAEEIIANLDRDFNVNVPDFINLDLLIFGGDVFDSHLNLGEEQCFAIKLWANTLLRQCKKYDIVVRFLEGTPAHDWFQSKIFISENELAEIDCDVKHIRVLDIEYIARFDINILYVPDEWRPDPDDTWLEVQALLAERGLKQIDFTVLHGTFEHQLPSHIKTHRHINARYESITRYFVLTGHIHLHSVEGRIIANGSYDRLTHNEEGPKGHVRLFVRLNGKHEIVFVENIGAKIYRTVDCRGLSLEAAYDKIHNALIKDNQPLPIDSMVRIRANREEPILMALDVIRKRYPDYNWSTPKVDQSTTSYTDVQSNLRVLERRVGITRENIAELVAQRLALRQVDPVHIQRALLLLNEVIKHGHTGT